MHAPTVFVIGIENRSTLSKNEIVYVCLSNFVYFPSVWMILDCVVLPFVPISAEYW